MSPPRRLKVWLGALACLAILGSVVWWSFSPQLPSESPPPVNRLPAASAMNPASGAKLTAAAVASDLEEVKARLLREQTQRMLAAAYQRAAAQPDFAMAPGRVLRSLLERRCPPPLRDPERCRSLLFAYLKERFSFPESITPAKLWALLDQVDAESDRTLVKPSAAASDEAFLAAYERFAGTRRGILGESLDRQLFGLADGLLHLPHQVRELAAETRNSPEQKLAAYHRLLEQLQLDHGVALATVVEPVELAKLELQIREASGALRLEQRQAVLQAYTSAEYARRYVAHQQAQESRSERLKAFNQEREQVLKRLADTGLTSEQLRQKMPEIDRQLLEKYQLE